VSFTPVVVDDTIARLKNIVDAEVAKQVVSPHWHVVYFPGGKVLTGPITDRLVVDRIALNASIKHPDRQVHVRGCTGRWCR
jgi:hypothetical protein